jgi:hypothetical protein
MQSLRDRVLFAANKELDKSIVSYYPLQPAMQIGLLIDFVNRQAMPF